MSVAAGTEIFYTGDMANNEGVFVASPVVGGGVDLVEVGGNRVFRSVRHIGATYDGTCNPRFVGVRLMWRLLEIGDVIVAGDEAFNRARRWDDATGFGDTVTVDSPPIRRKFGTVKSSVRSS